MLGLLPNTTHILQPLDVAVFGPLKREWSKAARKYTDEHPDEIVNQVTFAEVFIALYYDKVKRSNIQSGFRKCGLYPWNPNAVDYKKLECSAARREPPSTAFVGVNQDGKVDFCTQTEGIQAITKGIQINIPSFNKF